MFEVIPSANIAPIAIPKIKKKLIVEPDFPANWGGTSLGANENKTLVENPLLKAKSPICTNIITPNKTP